MSYTVKKKLKSLTHPMGMSGGERKKTYCPFSDSYNEFILTREFKSVLELSKICLQIHPLGEFDNLVIDFTREYRMLLSALGFKLCGDYALSSNFKAVFSIVSLCNVMFCRGSKS